MEGVSPSTMRGQDALAPKPSMGRRGPHEELSDRFLENVDAQGHVPVSQGPGLGVEMDWDYIEGHKRGEMVFE